MTARRLDGIQVAQQIQEELRAQLAELHGRGVRPGLGALLVGEDPASAVYVKSKTRRGEELGLYHQTRRLPANATMDAILTFAHEGCPYYDSLIAKLMTHGRAPAEASALMKRSLDVMPVEGIKTSIALPRRILDDPDIVAGPFDAGFMERFLSQRKASAAS